MHIPRIYCEQALAAHSSIELTAKASQHLRVLRHHLGQALVLFNGRGGEYSAKLNAWHEKIAIIEVLDFQNVCRELPVAVHIGQAIIANQRMDWLIQKSAELGVATITPLMTEWTSQKIPQDRLHKRLLHWQEVAINACEQSGRTILPTIQTPLSLAAWLGALPCANHWLLHPGDTAIPLSSISSLPATSIAVTIGPEGGLSPQDITLIQANVSKIISLGPRILRTETACVSLLSVLHYLAGESGNEQQ